MADRPVRPDPAAPPPDDDPVLPRITRDEQDVGWGDPAQYGDERARRDDWLMRERPPHHEG